MLCGLQLKVSLSRWPMKEAAVCITRDDVNNISAPVPSGDTSHQEGPVVAQELHHVPQRPEITHDLLDGNDIEPGQDLDDRPESPEIALR